MLNESIALLPQIDEQVVYEDDFEDVDEPKSAADTRSVKQKVSLFPNELRAALDLSSCNATSNEYEDEKDELKNEYSRDEYGENFPGQMDPAESYSVASRIDAVKQDSEHDITESLHSDANLGSVIAYSDSHHDHANTAVPNEDGDESASSAANDKSCAFENNLKHAVPLDISTILPDNASSRSKTVPLLSEKQKICSKAFGSHKLQLGNNTVSDASRITSKIASQKDATSRRVDRILDLLKTAQTSDETYTPPRTASTNQQIDLGMFDTMTSNPGNAVFDGVKQKLKSQQLEINEKTQTIISMKVKLDKQRESHKDQIEQAYLNLNIDRKDGNRSLFCKEKNMSK